MPTLPLNDRLLRGLEAPANGRGEWRDSLLPGFGVRVWRDRLGKRQVVLFLAYRFPARRDGQQRKESWEWPLFRLADARERAREILRQVADGLDPRRRSDAPTVAELSELYLVRIERDGRLCAREHRRVVAKDVLPRWGHRSAAEIRRRDVIAMVEAIIDERDAPGSAELALQVARSLFKFALAREMVEANPCAGVVPSRTVPRRRERVLSEDEIRRLWAALDSLQPGPAARMRLRLVAGQRLQAITSARWEWIGEETWYFPAETMKARRPHWLPLTPLVRAQLEVLRREAGSSPWVCPSPNPTRAGKPIHGMDQFITRRLCRKLGFEWEARDLRRTFASNLARLRVPAETRQRIMHQMIPGVHARNYDRHDYQDEMREALLLWESDLLGRILAPVEATPSTP